MCGYKGVCIRWLLRLLLQCFSIFLISIHPMFPCTENLLVCGHCLGSWSSHLLPSLTWLWCILSLNTVVGIFLDGFHYALHFASTSRTYCFHNSWKLHQCPFLQDTDQVPSNLSWPLLHHSSPPSPEDLAMAGQWSLCPSILPSLPARLLFLQLPDLHLGVWAALGYTCSLSGLPWFGAACHAWLLISCQR